MNDGIKTSLPNEIKKFNWGAFLLSWIWAIRHGVWIGLLSIIPILGWFFIPILGFKGKTGKDLFKQNAIWKIFYVISKYFAALFTDTGAKDEFLLSKVLIAVLSIDTVELLSFTWRQEPLCPANTLNFEYPISYTNQTKKHVCL